MPVRVPELVRFSEPVVCAETAPEAIAMAVAAKRIRIEDDDVMKNSPSDSLLIPHV